MAIANCHSQLFFPYLFLNITGIFSVFAEIVFNNQKLVDGGRRVDLQGMVGHPGYFFQYLGVVVCITGRFSRINMAWLFTSTPETPCSRAA